MNGGEVYSSSNNTRNIWSTILESYSKQHIHKLSIAELPRHRPRCWDSIKGTVPAGYRLGSIVHRLGSMTASRHLIYELGVKHILKIGDLDSRHPCSRVASILRTLLTPRVDVTVRCKTMLSSSHIFGRVCNFRVFEIKLINFLHYSLICTIIVNPPFN